MGLYQPFRNYVQGSRINRDSVKVGKPEISGETATVPVTSTMLGVTTTQSAKLKNTGDRWYVDIPK